MYQKLAQNREILSFKPVDDIPAPPFLSHSGVQAQARRELFVSALWGTRHEETRLSRFSRAGKELGTSGLFLSLQLGINHSAF